MSKQLTMIEIMDKQMKELREFDEPKIYEYVAKLRDDKGKIIPQKCVCGGSSKDFRQHIKGKFHLKFCKDNHVNVVIPLKNNDKTSDIKTYRKEYMRKYLSVSKNRDKQKEYNKNYRKNNLKKCLKAQKICRDNNKKKLEEIKELNKKMIEWTDEEMVLIKNKSKELDITAPQLARFIVKMITKWGDLHVSKNVNRVEFWINKYEKE